MECPLKMAAVILAANGGVSAMTDMRERGLSTCTATCAWWSGAGKPGYGDCSIAHLGYEASLKRYEREVE